MRTGAPLDARTQGGAAAAAGAWRCRGYGLDAGSALPLPGFDPAPDAAPAARLMIEVVAPDRLDHAPEGGEPLWETVLDEGRRFSCRRDGCGALRFEYGAAAVYSLDAPGSRLLAAPADPGDSGWQRVLTDSVLFCVRLAAGAQALHAGTVVIGGSATAVVAASGGGKTSLAAELVLRGHPLLCDDIAVLEHADGAVRVVPAPPLMNLPETLAERLRGAVDQIASFPAEGELWVRAHSVAREPARLGNVVLLRRGPRERTGIERVPATPLTLLPHAVYLGDDAERGQARFDLFSALADTASVWDLRAGPDASPADLAAMVEEAVA